MWSNVYLDWKESVNVSEPCIHWQIQGRGPGGPSPLVFRPNWGPRGRKSFFCDHPPPPPYLEVWMRHWYEHMTLSLSLSSLYCPYFLLLFPSLSFASLPLLLQWQSFHRVLFFCFCSFYSQYDSIQFKNGGGVCGRAVNTSNSGRGFKPRPSPCFLRQGSLLHFVSLHPGV